MIRNALIILALLITNMSTSQEKDAEPLDSKHFKRLYKLSDSIYRSEQPSKNGFTELENRGVKTILNLRRLKDDNRKAKHTNLKLKHVRLTSKAISEADIIEALSILHDAEKPILIHCWHGSDRTGIISASYRIVFEDWSKEDAIKEMRRPDFGHHEDWYPNMIALLKNLDIEKIRDTLNVEID